MHPLLLPMDTYHGVNIVMWLKQSKLAMQWQNFHHTIADILFSFMVEKYTVCDVCGLRSPSFESSSV